MRVLFVVHQYFPRWIGGTEMVVRRLAGELLATGHEPTIVTYHESPSGRIEDYGVRTTEFEGVPVYEIAYNLSLDADPARAEYDNTYVAAALAGVLEEISPDISHVAHAMKLSGAVFRVLRDARIPVVTSLSDYWFICMRHTLLRPGDVLCDGPDHRYRCLRCAGATHRLASPASRIFGDKWLWPLADICTFLNARLSPAIAPTFVRDVGNIAERQSRLRDLLLLSHRIVAFSPFLREMYARHGIPRQRIEVVRHGLTGPVDASAIEERQSRGVSRPLKILFAASLTSAKGAHILVEALRRVPELACELAIYGPTGPDKKYVERLQRAAAKDRRIRLVGGRPTEELAVALNRASILAYPAIWYENEPTVVKDALAVGLPVAASDLGSLRDLVGPVTGCTLLPAGDTAAWAAWLAGLTSIDPPAAVTPQDLPTFDQFYGRMFEIYTDLATR